MTFDRTPHTLRQADLAELMTGSRTGFTQQSLRWSLAESSRSSHSADPRVRKITFTGSREVGEHICLIAGLKKVTMELGNVKPGPADSSDYSVEDGYQRYRR